MTPANGTFSLVTLPQFTTGATVTPGLLKIVLDSDAGQTNWDLVKLDATGAAAVPEPSTLLLLGSGLAAMAAAVRKRAVRS